MLLFWMRQVFRADITAFLFVHMLVVYFNLRIMISCKLWCFTCAMPWGLAPSRFSGAQNLEWTDSIPVDRAVTDKGLTGIAELTPSRMAQARGTVPRRAGARCRARPAQLHTAGVASQARTCWRAPRRRVGDGRCGVAYARGALAGGRGRRPGACERPRCARARMRVVRASTGWRIAR